MERIASFAVNHDVLTRGMFLSRTDRDIHTYDLRMKEPNRDDYLANAPIHTFEHLFATFARNSRWKDEIVYFGPMGCRTGFYLLTRDAVSHKDAIRLVQEALAFIRDFDGEIPGTRREECGNFSEHDADGAKKIAREMIPVLEDWTEDRLSYPEPAQGSFV